MPLQIERLEDRRLLAAGISLAGGVLQIEGDNGANNIFVHSDAFVHSDEASLIYAGLDRNGDGDFDDAGDVLKVYESAQIKSIVINSKGGNDMVLVHLDDEISGDLVINSGAGADTIQIEHIAIGRDLKVNTGAGDDQVDLYESLVTRDAIIKTAAGNDLVTVDVLAVGRNLSIDTAAGDDAVGLSLLAIDGKLDVKLGAGNDLLAIEICSVLVDPRKMSLDGGGGAFDRLVVCSEENLEAAIEQGAKVKQFEITEEIENVSPTTDAILTLVEHRFDAGELRLELFHNTVDDVIFGVPG